MKKVLMRLKIVTTVHPFASVKISVKICARIYLSVKICAHIYVDLTEV